MAKRSNPFIEDFVQQRKVHVGLKQFNNNEDRLKKVYEKTLQLLFKGAKKAAPDVTNVSDTAPHHDKKDGMKQLFIGKDGSLLRSGTMVRESTAPTLQCHCGHAAASPAPAPCGYCEAALCGACQRLCARCERAYCAQCSLSGPEGTEVCVSCYG